MKYVEGAKVDIYVTVNDITPFAVVYDGNIFDTELKRTVEVDEPLTKENKSELLRNELNKQLGNVTYLKFSSSEGSTTSSKNEYVTANGNVLDVVAEAYLYNNETKQFVMDGDKKKDFTKPGAFDDLQPGNYTLEMGLQKDNRVEWLTDGNRSARHKYYFNHNIVADITFKFPEEKELPMEPKEPSWEVTSTNSTMPEYELDSTRPVIEAVPVESVVTPSIKDEEEDHVLSSKDAVLPTNEEEKAMVSDLNTGALKEASVELDTKEDKLTALAGTKAEVSEKDMLIPTTTERKQVPHTADGELPQTVTVNAFLAMILLSAAGLYTGFRKYQNSVANL